MKRPVVQTLLLVLSLLMGSIAFAGGTVNFEPVRAPSKGPDNAPVTVIEIADFM